MLGEPSTRWWPRGSKKLMHTNSCTIKNLCIFCLTRTFRRTKLVPCFKPWNWSNEWKKHHWIVISRFFFMFCYSWKSWLSQTSKSGIPVICKEHEKFQVHQIIEKDLKSNILNSLKFIISDYNSWTIDLEV